jgi:xylose dehydrogenase (NAD/NADP)
MTRNLTWGLLSTARINRRLIPAIRAARGHRLRAVASRELERAKKYAREWSIPKAYGSYEELLADPVVDIIYNSLPNNLHTEWCVRAAEAGKHVLCEKPLALSTQEVDTIIAAAHEHKVVIAEAFMYRSLERTFKLKELLQSGVIGEVHHINSTYTVQLGRPDNYRWRPENGGGSLWDLGCYPVSYARLIMDTNPVEVYGVADNTELGVDRAFTCLLTYASGSTARFFTSFDLPLESNLEIQGTLGTIFYDKPVLPEKGMQPVLVKGGRVKKIKAPLPRELYQGEVEDFGNAVLNRAEQRLTLNESRDINQVLVALYESAKIGAPVKI